MYQALALSLFLLLPPLLLLLLSIKGAKSNKLSLPPSPPKLPFIGNLHLLGSVPHRSLQSLSNKHGPIMLLQLGQIPTLVISSPELARDVMKTHDLIFANRPPSKIARLILGNDIAFAPYGEYWRQGRKLCVTHLLSSKMVQSFQHVREEEVELMIANIFRICSLDPVVNLSEVLHSFSSNVISRIISFEFFREEERKRTLRKLNMESSDLLGGFHVAEFFPQIGWAIDYIPGMDVSSRAKKIGEKWSDILDEVITEHTNRSLDDDVAHKNSDFIDVLLSLEKERSSIDFPFTRDNIKAILIDMFGAGIDTSYIALEWSIAELVRNPKVMKKLQDEVRGASTSKAVVREEDLNKMSYIKAVIKEVMRLHPPVPFLLPRESTENCQLAGYRVPKGTRVIINAWAIARDPNFWEEPDEFKPERFTTITLDYKGNDFQFIPFGAGRRICPGLNFAEQNIELALANLVNRFDWELPGNMSIEELDMNDSPGLTAHKKERLDLAARPFSFE